MATNTLPQPDSAPEKRTSFKTIILTTTLCSAVFLAALDITRVTTALPSIADDFQSTSAFVWVGSGFLLAAAVVAPSWGKFSDIWGRKSILLIAISIFFLGSALSGAAVSLEMLVAGRVVQGIGAGGLLSLVAIVIGDLFSPRHGLGPCLYPRASSRRRLYDWGVLEMVLLYQLAYIWYRLYPHHVHVEPRKPQDATDCRLKAVDWLGSVSLTGGLLMVLLGLEFGGTTHPWSSAIVICLLIFGLFTCIIFIVIEKYVARYPIIPVHLYASISNFAIFIVNLFHGIAFTSNTYFLPLYCQSVLEAGPLLSGVLLLPFAGLMSVGTVGAGFYLKKTGRYLDCIYVGFFLLILGIGLLYDLPGSRYWPKIILYQSISGFGIGLLFQPPLIALQDSLPRQDNAATTSSFGLTRNVASAIGVVVGSVAFSTRMDAQRHILADALGTSSAELFSGSNAQANVPLIQDFDSQQQDVIRQVFRVALRDIWLVAVCFGGVGFLASLLIRHKALGITHVEVVTGLAGEEERRKVALEQKTKSKRLRVSDRAPAETSVTVDTE